MGIICRNCSQLKIWKDDMERINQNPDDEEFERYEPTCPCEYCTLNNIGY